MSFGIIEKASYWVNLCIRTEAKEDSSLMTRIGFYDTKQKKIISVYPLKVQDISGREYKKTSFRTGRIVFRCIFLYRWIQQKNS